MGFTSYSTSSRAKRAVDSGYHSKSVNEIFEQNQKRMIHESMKPQSAVLREARDSEIHPNSVPIILALDVTGSMGKIPHHLVQDGLPKIMGKIMQNGVPDPSLLFLAIGDTECDTYPLQVGQFESGDEELDTWLTRTYIESGGGGNDGESYLLAWYFAAKHTELDSFSKRGKKGFLFTIGDEPSLKSIPRNVIEEQMGVNPQTSFTDVELLEMARKMYHVYHFHILEGYGGKSSLGYWKDMLGQSCIEIQDYKEIPAKLAEIVVKHSNSESENSVILEKDKVTDKVTFDVTDNDTDKEEEML